MQPNIQITMLHTHTHTDNPQLFLNPEFSDEDKEILENIFLYKEKLISEIKVIVLVVIFVLQMNIFSTR